MRRVPFLFLSVLLFLAAFPQQAGEPVLVLKALPEKGVILKEGWTFHPEDDRRYAYNHFEARDGIPVNPALLLEQLPQVKEAGVGWFRLRMRVDSSLRHQTIGLMISLFGAAEIYLNGKQVYRFGQVSGNYDTEETQAIYARAMSLTLSGEEDQLLAVRFSHHRKNVGLKAGIIPYCLRLTLLPLNKVVDRYAILVKRVYRFLAVGLTIELTAALLTLFFFFSFPSRKEYLYFGLYFAFNFLGMLVQSAAAGVSKVEYITVNQLTAIQLVVYFFLIIGTLFHLKAIYALLHIKQTRYYRFLFWYAIISMVLIPFLTDWTSLLPGLFFPLACFEVLPLYYRAARRNFRGAWILFFSILLCFLFLLLLTNANLESNMEFIIVFTALVLLTPALGVMIFLAGEFARTSLDLKQRIVEVETLSEKNLAQEREKQEILAAQKESLEKEVQHRTAALRQSLADLKAAQAKLVQAEKMASLGEVTAGVAHEIQNPLNFINNFSDINNELTDELEQTLKGGKTAEAKQLLHDLKINQEKISHHGRRADAIVKSMLQHSRRSTGEKELININVLAEEYLQLSYQGFRAKNAGFNASCKTDFDERIGKVAVVPQEIGRVFLNLFNNAFYAVAEKKKRMNGSFEPLVTVSTEDDGGQVRIRISDNGTGIPQHALDKIFQPFFTTKPTGEGTGLGLSLSYDIITKGHSGELKIQTKEGEGATFIIQLPKE